MGQSLRRDSVHRGLREGPKRAFHRGGTVETVELASVGIMLPAKAENLPRTPAAEAIGS